MMTDPKIILIHETWAEGAARDLTTFATVITFWSVGWFAESPALEWLGVACAVWFTFARAVRLLKKQKGGMTPDEARAWLDDAFPQKDRPHD